MSIRCLWAAGWLVLLVMSARTGMGQAVARKDSNQKVTISTPISLPLVAMLNTFSQYLTAEDSLNRVVYARNRVKTVTVLRAGSPDTVEYTELDRRGNQTLIAKPYFGQHRRQAFDKQGRLVEIVMMPTPDFRKSARILYEPGKQLYTTYVTIEGAAPVLWQQAQLLRRGDTLTTDAIFLPVPGMDEEPSRRLVTRRYPTGGDSARYEVVGYGANDQPTDFSAHTHIRKQGRLLESGPLDFQPSASASATQQQRLSRMQRGRFTTSTRNVYDKRGLLIRTTMFPAPSPVGPKPVRNLSHDSGGSITASREIPPIASYSTVYQRNPDGRIQREDQTFELRPGTLDPNMQKMFNPTYTEYEYGKNGLLQRKISTQGGMAGAPAQVYEVRYTYY